MAIAKDKTTGKWGPVGFVRAGEGSFGFQAGAQRNDMILVLMNSLRSFRAVLVDHVKLNLYDIALIRSSHEIIPDPNPEVEFIFPLRIRIRGHRLFRGWNVRRLSQLQDN